MKNISKLIICMAIMSALVFAPVLTTKAYAAEVTQTQTQDVQSANSKRELSWGVLLFAVGEVAGTIGLGISHVRKTKREEQMAKQLEQQRMPKGEPIVAYSKEQNSAKV